ncbi:hypothetical protein NDU88_008789 [Pleurodeles waltl]|uniref:Secreted protein n=1 Tax=Pleurodeles waltl TaxID=8319 RepID=A0AAV7PSL5_PLEWA|nr:hypothetical protein NDU88_008789 [Pleurodeles waltl]
MSADARGLGVLLVPSALARKCFFRHREMPRRWTVRGHLNPLKKRKEERRRHRSITRQLRKSRPQRWGRKQEHRSQASKVTIRRQQDAEDCHTLGRE